MNTEGHQRNIGALEGMILEENLDEAGFSGQGTVNQGWS
jgi:hypothetical protein